MHSCIHAYMHITWGVLVSQLVLDDGHTYISTNIHTYIHTDIHNKALRERAYITVIISSSCMYACMCSYMYARVKHTYMIKPSVVSLYK